jgi:hypothetical protein
MRKGLSGDLILKVAVDHSDRSANGGDVPARAKHIHGIIQQFRHLILGENLRGNELPQQSDENGGTGVTKLMGTAASKHDKSPRFGVVWCDESGRLYRIDRETDQYIPLSISDAFSSKP